MSEPDTGSTLTRTGGSAPSRELWASATGAIFWRNSLSCVCAGGYRRPDAWGIGQGGRSGGHRPRGSLWRRNACGIPAAMPSRCDSVAVRFGGGAAEWRVRLSFGCKAVRAGTAATVGGGTTTAGLHGPPTARTDSVMGAAEESNSSRNVTSQFLGQYTTLPSLSCLESSSSLCSSCPSLIHSTPPLAGRGARSHVRRRLLPVLVTFKARDGPGAGAGPRWGATESGLRLRIP